MELVEFGDIPRHILLVVEELEHNSIVVIQKTIAVFKNASVQIGRRHHINVQQQEVSRFNAINPNVTQDVQRIDSFGILLLRRIPPQIGDNRGQAPNVDVEQDVLSVDRHDELCQQSQLNLINAEYTVYGPLPSLEKIGEPINASVSTCWDNSHRKTIVGSPMWLPWNRRCECLVVSFCGKEMHGVGA